MRHRLHISPERYFLVSAVALVALTLIVFTGAAVRVTGSGLGCPDWPNCYQNGRLVAELNSHAWIEFGHRLLTSVAGLPARSRRARAAAAARRARAGGDGRPDRALRARPGLGHGPLRALDGRARG